MTNNRADLILFNGKIATQDDRRTVAQAVAIRDGKFTAVGTDRDVMAFRTGDTKLVDLSKRVMIPGLNDCRRGSGSAWWAGGLNSNSPNAGCQLWRS